ncbi:MAG: hypothetical protein EOM74_04770, partial [Methanomicrobia archaeon]|nr:hypothetical protein [Methanomicrobia archaeon]
MNFENPVYNEKVEKKDSDLEKMAADLSDYCKQHGNPIKIYQIGKNREQAVNLHPSLGEKQVDGSIHDILRSVLEKMLDFVHAPIFTDSFSEDHYSR